MYWLREIGSREERIIRMLHFDHADIVMFDLDRDSSRDQMVFQPTGLKTVRGTINNDIRHSECDSK